VSVLSFQDSINFEENKQFVLISIPIAPIAIAKLRIILTLILTQDAQAARRDKRQIPSLQPISALALSRFAKSSAMAPDRYWLAHTMGSVAGYSQSNWSFWRDGYSFTKSVQSAIGQ
jgi:hypothetical protein